MKDLIDKTREKYESKRNKFSFFERAYFNKLKKPSWARKRDNRIFDIVYRDQNLLYSEGKIVLACIFKANSLLFKNGKTDYPAAVIFSEDPYFEENFYELDLIVESLIDISDGYSADSEFRNLARILNDERSAHFNILLPPTISNGRKVYFTTIMVHRKHLPSKCLKSDRFLLLVCPSKTKASIILPYRYWDIKLIKMWRMKKILPKQKFR
ncbi:MAG TPA: hypothetical protein PK604_12425 [Acetivibrio clariflavus]|nr:hypothetical protein [Acetivibrio clariflavus]